MPRLSQSHIKPVLCVVRNGKRGRQYDCRKRYACGNGAFLQVKKEKNKGLGLLVAKGTLRKGQKVGDFEVVDVRDEPDEDKYCFKYNGKYHVTDMDCLMNRINYGHPKNCRFGQVNHGRVPVFATKTIRAGTFLNTLYGDKGHLLQMKIETKTAATYSPTKHKQERNGTRNSRDEDNDDHCHVCKTKAELVCCDTCPKAFCFRHAETSNKRLNEDCYFCDECLDKKIKYPNRFRPTSSTSRLGSSVE